MADGQLAHQGDIWLVQLGAGRKGEPGKNRPCVIITADDVRAGTPFDLVLVAPITTARAATPLRPAITAGNGLDADSAVLCDGLRAVVPSRLLRQLGVTPAADMARIMTAISRVQHYESPAQTL